MEENNFEEPRPPIDKGTNDPVGGPQMSEISSLGNIFIEPENTFKYLGRKPRFIIAGIIIALLVGAYTIGVGMKVGDAGMRSFIEDQVNKSPRSDSMSKEQKAQAVNIQMTISKYTQYAVPLFVFISFFIGALLYWLGAKMFGGTGSFMSNLSVWVYSAFPPAVVGMIANFIVLALKPAEDIDLAASQRGLLHANLGFFIDGKAMPMLATFLSTIDVFAIWGWILAAIGLRTVNKISKGSSWAVVLMLVIIGLAFRLLGSMFSGNPS